MERSFGLSGKRGPKIDTQYTLWCGYENSDQTAQSNIVRGVQILSTNWRQALTRDGSNGDLKIQKIQMNKVIKRSRIQEKKENKRNIWCGHHTTFLILITHVKCTTFLNGEIIYIKKKKKNHQPSLLFNLTYFKC